LKLANAVSNATTYQFQCEGCGKRYKERSGAWRHKQKCTVTVAVTTTVAATVDQSMNYVDVIHKLLTDNHELRTFLIEQSNEHKRETADLMNRVVEISKPNMVNTINSNNKSFNINVFLNEHCKDALNLDQFMNGFEVSREDLMNTGRLGFVEGISKIFLDNLKMLSITKRPIHCTDAKRETIYIKEADKWSKEEDDSKLCKAIQEVSRRSTGTLLNWKRSNPDYIDGDSDFSIQCIAMQRNSIAGYERDTLYPKVINVIAKEMLIDKGKTAIEFA
jgi:hypothetical protein